MLDLTDVKNFYSDKDLTRCEYLKRSFLIIGIVAAVHVLFVFKFSHRHTSTTLQWTFDIIVGSILLIWILTDEIVTQIKLDFDNKKFIAHYMTIFSDDNKIEVPFEYLTFSFNKEPSKHQPKKWVLKIFNKRKKAFSMETNKDGFSQETLDSLVEELKKIQVFVG